MASTIQISREKVLKTCFTYAVEVNFTRQLIYKDTPQEYDSCIAINCTNRGKFFLKIVSELKLK